MTKECKLNSAYPNPITSSYAAQSYQRQRQLTLGDLLLENRIVFLQGEIHTGNANELVMKLLYLQSENRRKDIHFYLNSPGGDVVATLAIYDTMQILSCPVATYCVGQAASGAAVLLCGGTGKRLWPASRKSMPKQFARLGGDDSLLQATVRRIEDITCTPPMLLTAHDYRFVVAEHLAELGSEGHRIVVEPEGRNTAPAICAAAELVHDTDPNALVLICPADHVVEDVMALAQAVTAAIPSAINGQIVTFGIRPDRPETGYGYIELSNPGAADSLPQPFVRFVEKPDAEMAQVLFEGGRHVWNAGIFLASAKTLRDAFSRHASRMRACVRRALREAVTDLDFLRLGAAYKDAENISIDFAIMEHEAGIVVPVTAGWNDLGSWRAVWQTSSRDKDGVATSGQALSLDCANTLLDSRDPGIQVVGIGLRNIAAIATRDAVLIAALDSAQSVAEAVEVLKRDKAPPGRSVPPGIPSLGSL